MEQKYGQMDMFVYILLFIAYKEFPFQIDSISHNLSEYSEIQLHV